ncbi:hypothetical protein STEG23_009487, partial [Scotinomys teguina]
EPCDMEPERVYEILLTSFKSRNDAGEMDQTLKALAALAEDLTLVLSIHIAVYNCSVTPVPGNRTPFSDFCRHQTGTRYTDIHAGRLHKKEHTSDTVIQPEPMARDIGSRGEPTIILLNGHSIKLIPNDLPLYAADGS